MKAWFGVWVALAVAMAASASTPKPGAPAPAAPASRGAMADLVDAVKAWQASDIATAYEKAKQAVGEPDFADLAPIQQRAGYDLLAATGAELGKFEEARVAVKKATELPGATALEWQERLHLAARLDDKEDEAHSLDVIARSYPAALSKLNDSYVDTFVRTEVPKLADGRARQLELLDALAAADWKPDETEVSLDRLWFRQMLNWLERNRPDKASELAPKIRQPFAVIQMRVDKRFDAVLGPDRARYDVAAAAEKDLAHARANMAAAPDRLAPIYEVATRLLSLGRAGEALALLDGALKRALPPDGSRSTLVDADKVNWTFDARARALVQLGRFDEAVAQLAQGARRPEHGSVNVSQSINLGDLLWRLGRPREALAPVADIADRDVSPYGRLAAAEVRACAYSQLRDAAALARSVAYVRAHADDSPMIMMNVLICAGDADGAAGVLIERLQNPERRTDALVQIQTYADPPHRPPFEVEIQRRRQAILARPDVQAAVQRVGRIERQPLTEPQY